ncbi:MAG: choice-of-anchor L domain-containing protein, partial [Actinobacteria bacterium]|nr:choice-of-anchor L domain-containing protein [Actinomycetota bacterium]
MSGRTKGRALGLLALGALLLTISAPVAAGDGGRTPDLWPATPIESSHVTTAGVISALDLAAADVASLGFGTSDHTCFDVIGSAVSGFPVQGADFLALGSGATSFITLPNTSGSTSYVCGGLNQSQGNDMVQMAITLNVPTGQTSVHFDWKFFSEEYPEWVGTPFNDAFLVETPTSTFTISGISTISAPNNVAFDSAGNPITINSTGVYGMSLADAFGTTYDGATTTFTTTYPFAAGTTSITLIFSVMDLGDSIYDTMVFVDKLRFGTATGGPGTTPSEICGNGIDDDNDGLVDEGCVPVSDLSLDKDGPALVTEGGTVTYDLTVSNGGPDDA